MFSALNKNVQCDKDNTYRKIFQDFIRTTLSAEERRGCNRNYFCDLQKFL